MSDEIKATEKKSNSGRNTFLSVSAVILIGFAIVAFTSAGPPRYCDALTAQGEMKEGKAVGI